MSETTLQDAEDSRLLTQYSLTKNTNSMLHSMIDYLVKRAQNGYYNALCGPGKLAGTMKYVLTGYPYCFNVRTVNKCELLISWDKKCIGDHISFIEFSFPTADGLREIDMGKSKGHEYCLENIKYKINEACEKGLYEIDIDPEYDETILKILKQHNYHIGRDKNTIGWVKPNSTYVQGSNCRISYV